MPPASTGTPGIRVDLLGGVRVFAEGRELTALAAQRVSCALLVLIAVDRDVTREAAVATIWPDSSPEKARRTLSQTLYRLRTTLGRECVEGRADRLCIEGTIAVDAAAFEAAAAAGDRERALELYCGPFLGTHNLSVSPAFEVWAESTRARLSRTFRTLLVQFVEERTQSGEEEAAIRAARRAVDMDPTDDEVQSLLIHLLGRTNAPAALAQFERYVDALALIDAEPPGAIVEYAQGLRSGPRPIPQVALPEPRPRVVTKTPQPLVAKTPAPAGAVSPWRRLAAVAALAVAILAVVLLWRTDQPSALTIGRPAVQIFVDEFRDMSSPPALERTAAALTEHVRTALVGVAGLRVTGVGSVTFIDELAVTRDSIDALFRAEYLVSAFVDRSDSTIEVIASLVDPTTRTRLAVDSFFAPPAEDPASRRQVGQQIADFVRRAIGREQRRRAPANDHDPAVRRLIGEAERHAAQSVRLRLAGLFDDAANELAAADSILADAERIDASDAALTILRARNAETRGLVALFQRQTPLPHTTTGLRHVRRALQTDPEHVDAFEARARLRRLALPHLPPDSARSLAPLVEDDLRRVIQADPANAIAVDMLGNLQYQRGEYQHSLVSKRRARQLDPYLETDWSVSERLGMILYELGQDEEAHAECDAAWQREPTRSPLAVCRLFLAAFAPPADLDTAGVVERIGALAASLPPGDVQNTRLRFAPLAALAWRNVGAPDSARAVRAQADASDTPIPGGTEAAYFAAIGDLDSAYRILERFIAETWNANTESRMYTPMRADSSRWKDLQSRAMAKR